MPVVYMPMADHEELDTSELIGRTVPVVRVLELFRFGIRVLVIATETHTNLVITTYLPHHLAILTITP